jgi:hypothetical protein
MNRSFIQYTDLYELKRLEIQNKTKLIEASIKFYIHLLSYISTFTRLLSEIKEIKKVFIVILLQIGRKISFIGC